MGEESTVPGSETRWRASLPRLAAVIPAAAESFVRCASKPNNGQSPAAPVLTCAGEPGLAGVEAVGVEAAGAVWLLSQAAISTAIRIVSANRRAGGVCVRIAGVLPGRRCGRRR